MFDEIVPQELESFEVPIEEHSIVLFSLALDIADTTLASWARYSNVKALSQHLKEETRPQNKQTNKQTKKKKKKKEKDEFAQVPERAYGDDDPQPCW